MRVQKIILYLLLATMAVGCDQFGGFDGCWGCDGFYGCKQWDLADDHFTKHQSSGLPFGMFFSVTGGGNFNVYGPSANGTENSDALAYLGIQHFLSNSYALRVGATFITANDGAETDDRTNSEYGIGVGVYRYFRPLYNIAPYMGVGVGYSTSTNQSYMPPESVLDKQIPQGVGSPIGETTANTFGISAIAGFDWYVTPNIAFGTEYALGFASQSGTYTPDQGSSVDLPSATTIGIAPAGNVHILIHF